MEKYLRINTPLLMRYTKGFSAVTLVAVGIYQSWINLLCFDKLSSINDQLSATYLSGYWAFFYFSVFTSLSEDNNESVNPVHHHNCLPGCATWHKAFLLFQTLSRMSITPHKGKFDWMPILTRQRREIITEKGRIVRI